MKYISIFFLALFSFSSIQAQSIDEELGFIYVKAEYLLETNRYEDAIKELNKIVDKDPAYKDVLYQRAYAKYMIAAFAGTKKDLLQSFDIVGITPESVDLYGKALESLGQKKAATKTQETASMIKGHSSKTRTETADNDRNREEDNSEEGRENPDDEKSQMKKIEDAIGSILDDLLPDRADESEETSSEGGTAEESQTSSEEGGEMDSGNRRRGDNKGSSSTKREEEEKDVYQPDMSVKEIYIDEDLTLNFKDGIGGFKIAHFPTILILSESSGKVEVDVCVNANGDVSSADFNRGNSTISSQSLISVALRKSKEFKFDNDARKEICGTIVYKITGGR